MPPVNAPAGEASSWNGSPPVPESVQVLLPAFKVVMLLSPDLPTLRTPETVNPPVPPVWVVIVLDAAGRALLLENVRSLNVQSV